MDKNQLVTLIFENIKENPKDAKHIIYSWLKIFNTYPEQKEAIKKLIHEDYFPKWHEFTFDGEFKFRPVMTALALSKYFIEIVFKEGLTQNEKEFIEEKLIAFYYDCFFHFESVTIRNFNPFFEKNIASKIQWDDVLLSQLRHHSPDKELIKKIIDLVFDYSFISTNFTLSVNKQPLLKSRDYFRMISMDIKISPIKLKDRILSGNFPLFEVNSWREPFMYYLKFKKLPRNLRNTYKKESEQNNLEKHFESVCADTALMVFFKL